MSDAILVLANGTTYPGVSFGATLPTVAQLETRMAQRTPRGIGEVVFCTAMSGYHELLTDPSYTGQIVTMTYPHVGNYGCDDEWSESGRATDSTRREVSPSGLICRSLYTGPVPERRQTLHEYLRSPGVPGVSDVDTRRLTFCLRDEGARNGAMGGLESGVGDSVVREAASRVADLLRSFPPMEGRALIGEVGTEHGTTENPDGSPHLVLLDCGAKAGIIRNLVRAGCRISVLPSDTDARAVQDTGADALFVSNGPGDPGVLSKQVNLIREIIGEMPVLGICLGHQLIALALGAATYKMPFGHHGVNHPVRDRQTGSVFVTSQNHGFAVDPDSLPDGCEVWFDNANDGTTEGIVNRDLKVRTTQFHPEAAPGPFDCGRIFETFVKTARGES